MIQNFNLNSFAYGCTAILPDKANLLHEQELMRPSEMMPGRGQKYRVAAHGTDCSIFFRPVEEPRT